MAGQTSGKMLAAMRFVLEAHLTPYAAAKRAQIDPTTMYRSKLYKLWRAGDMDALAKAMDISGPKPRRRTKRERYSGSS